MADSDSGAGGAMWAVSTLLIVVMVLAVLYFSGVLGGGRKSTIDVNVNTPSVPSTK